MLLIERVVLFLVTALYPSFNLNWSREVTAALQVLSFINANVDMAAPECSAGRAIGFYFKFIVKMCLPLAVGAVLVAAYELVRLQNYLSEIFLVEQKSTRFNILARRFSDSDMRFLRYAMWRSILITITFIYLPLSTAILSYFDCNQVC